jgi:hypothetical protein
MKPHQFLDCTTGPPLSRTTPLPVSQTLLHVTSHPAVTSRNVERPARLDAPPILLTVSARRPALRVAGEANPVDAAILPSAHARQAIRAISQPRI